MQNRIHPIRTADEEPPEFKRPAPRPLQSGSRVLDRMFARSGLQTRQLLHLYGGYRGLHQQLGLLICKAACERGEKASFLNLGDPVQSEMLHRLGLSPFFNSDPNLPLRQRLLQPFHLLSPKLTNDQSLEEQVKTIQRLIVGDCAAAGFSGKRLTLVVDHLERAFESPTKRLSPSDVTWALDTTAHWLREFSWLCGETGVTVWLTHSSDEAFPRGTDNGDHRSNPLDLNERGELVRRSPAGNRKNRFASPTPFQQGMTWMLCGKRAESSAPEVESRYVPALFSLEVGHPSLLYSPSKLGDTRFAQPVQLWHAGERAGKVEWLLRDNTYQFDNTPNPWSPKLPKAKRKSDIPDACPGLKIPIVKTLRF